MQSVGSTKKWKNWVLRCWAQFWDIGARAVHGAVQPVLEGFFAPHLQGWVFLIPNRTSSVDGWEPVYIRCSVRYRFGTVSSVNFSFFQVPNTMQLTTPNHIMLIKKTQIFYKQKKKKKKQQTNSWYFIKHNQFPITKNPNKKLNQTHKRSNKHHWK